jgi:hypothetical protein
VNSWPQLLSSPYDVRFVRPGYGLKFALGLIENHISTVEFHAHIDATAHGALQPSTMLRRFLVPIYDGADALVAMSGL